MARKPTYEELRLRVAQLEKAVAASGRMEAALRESEQTYRTLAEKSVAGIYVVQNGKFHGVNYNAASYAGYTIRELVGKKSDSIVHPEDRDKVKSNARMMLRGERSAPHEFRIVTKRGDIRWIMETVSSITYKGKPAILGNSMDITERKRAEEQLQESEARYRTIFETTGTATIIIEADTTISLVNTEFEKLSDASKAYWEGKRSWKEIVVKKDIPRMIKYHYQRRADPDAAPRNYEFGFVDSRGNLKDVLITIGMIEGTKKSVASLLDITRFKQAEETLKKRGTELEVKTHELQELNAALRVLLKRREEDRNELEEKVLSNVKKLVLPYLEKIKNTDQSVQNMTNLTILESNLKDIVSTFSHKLSSKYLSLTPKEIQVANLIKEGKTTKEIAEFLNVSPSAINICRYRIRHKLGLNKSKSNLQSYLSCLT